MNTYRVSYQNAEDKVIRNRHKRVKAATVEQARDIVLSLGQYIAIYKVETI